MNIMQARFHDRLVDRKPTGPRHARTGLVLPRDVSRGVEICVQFERASSTLENRLTASVGLFDMPAMAASLRCVSRVDAGNGASAFFGFVFQEATKTFEAPRMHAPSRSPASLFGSLANVLQILNDDHSSGLGAFDNLSREDVVAVSPETLDATTNAFQMTLGRCGARRSTVVGRLTVDASACRLRSGENIKREKQAKGERRRDHSAVEQWNACRPTMCHLRRGSEFHACFSTATRSYQHQEEAREPAPYNNRRGGCISCRNSGRRGMHFGSLGGFTRKQKCAVSCNRRNLLRGTEPVFGCGYWCWHYWYALPTKPELEANLQVGTHLCCRELFFTADKTMASYQACTGGAVHRTSRIKGAINYYCTIFPRTASRDRASVSRTQSERTGVSSAVQSNSIALLDWVSVSNDLVEACGLLPHGFQQCLSLFRGGMEIEAEGSLHIHSIRHFDVSVQLARKENGYSSVA